MEAKTFKIGNTTIIIRATTPREIDIKKCYDICNELFAGKSECFYTKEETRQKNILLRSKQEEVIS
ncbi:hypothetical protein [Clostridium isatidis]|uniref:hypothetical protein n=1 Tax=Clostridium isatidis TaxID=182773 RepID=UPI003AAF69A9